ncbi:heterokaryon incompatibility protein (het-6OR allele) [Fusarium globosum]|uniref:Heterokaryon incompatibility protein (Het-6OR allele) n=1 Tax=Fusarium globosum TaxID=78864 RepID=A0A8H5YH73_9HYPO|nr:heterokaryon incompatibility protein (het-6OR allele) [Fusarium globosum]
MSPSGNSRLYAPLDRSRREIRVIEILSTKPRIVCNLTTVSLDQGPEFSAISYLWGDNGKPEAITVNGIERFITPSLASALEYVPYHWKNAFPERKSQSCRVWADALCINQDEDLEKSHQVELMKFIYPAAELVFSCLDIGALQSDVRLAFKTCETLAKCALERDLARPAYNVYSNIEEKSAQDFDWLLQHPFLDENYPINSQEFTDAEQAVSRTFGLKYWERAWIFQELALSKRVVVIYQLEFIDLKSLLDAQSCIQLLKRTAEVKSKPAGYGVWCLWHSLSKIREVDWARACVHGGKNAQESVLRDMRSLLPLLYGRYGTKDPKDQVYALLGVIPLNIEPDYTSQMTVASVYVAACAEILKWHRVQYGWPLCFLSGAGLVHRSHGQGYELPSWVCNFAENSGMNKSPQSLFGLHGREDNYTWPEKWNRLEAPSIRRYNLTCSTVFLHNIVDATPTLFELQDTWLNFVSATFRMIHRTLRDAEDSHPLWLLARVFGAEDLDVHGWETPMVTRLIRIFQYLLLLCQVPIKDDGTFDANAVGKAETVAEEILEKLTEKVLKQDSQQSDENCNKREKAIQSCRELISRVRDKESFWKDMRNRKIQLDINELLKIQQRSVSLKVASLSHFHV